MLSIDYHSNFLNELQAIFNNSHSPINEEEISKLKKELDNTTQFLEDIVVVLTDVRNDSRIYFSKSIEKLSGYSREEAYKMHPFTPIAFKHLSYPLKTLRYSKKFGKNLSPLERKMATFSSCGLQVKDKWGQKQKLLVKSSVVSLDEHNKPHIIIEQWENISAIFKGEHYWARWKCQDKTLAFINQKGKKEFTDLLSPKEKIVVFWALKGKNTQAIADHLNLSKGTIETHRKNILNKTGFTSIEIFNFIWNKMK